jgi:hypothetical protein
MNDGAVSNTASLKVFHYIAGDVSVLVKSLFSDNGGLGEGLKPKFAAEAIVTRSVPFKGFSFVPYPPEMAVSACRICVMFTIALRAMRATWPIASFWHFFHEDVG